MYDAIVIGAGNGGLISALILQKAGKRVKVLEANQNSGGLATSFVRGRFEFEVSLQEVYEYGNANFHGSLYELFETLGLNDKISMVPNLESFHILCRATREEYIFPFEIPAFIERMEQYVPGSRDAMQQFFSVGEECSAALAYLRDMHFQADDREIQSRFPNFSKYFSLSLQEGLDFLKVPLRAQEFMSSFWLKLGLPSSMISFFTYVLRMSSYLTNGGWVPKLRSREMSLAIQSEFERLGGEIDFLTSAQRVIYENGVLCGVQSSDGKVYQTHHVISNISPNVFAGSFLPPEVMTKEMNEMINVSAFGAKAFCVYLGLNKSVEELGLSTYQYYILDSLDSNALYEQAKTMNFHHVIATVLNHVNPECSSKGTTILTLTSFQFWDIFSRVVSVDNYYDVKRKVAEEMISLFESATGLAIRETIEEIEIATPATFARFTGHPDGTIFGYSPYKEDDYLSRLANHSFETILPNVRFCGGFKERLHGYASSYLSGATAAMETLEDLNKEMGSYEA